MVVAKELKETGTIRDPARGRLLETRKAVIANWMRTADALDAQGEIPLAGQVRYFARHLPPVLTDKERLATEFVRYIKGRATAHIVAISTPSREDGLTR